ncbi:MAG: hypothetical protein ACRC3Z_02465, partial [Phocaeicola sp.]
MNKNRHEGKSYWFAFYEGQLMIDQIGNSYHVPYQIDSPTLLNEEVTIHECGEINGIPCKAYALHEPLQEENEELTLLKSKQSDKYDTSYLTTSIEKPSCAKGI